LGATAEALATPEATTPEAATAEVAPTEEPAATDEPVTASCPEAAEGTYLLRDPRHGFCLLYPETHKVERPNADEVALVVGSLLNASDPRATILVTDSAGRTAADLADEIVTDFEGFEITRTETTVAGEPAIELDGVPGQDINQRVIFTHGDKLYHIYLSPFDQDNLREMDTFRQIILSSFTFIPISDTVTAADECVAPQADEQSVTSEEFGFCFVVPADFTYEQPSGTNANVFVGSMMDVEHPKLMIEVTDAAGKTAAEAADELVASFEGFEIPRTFGDTLGYEVAERLDGVPGQDLGRVLLAVHNDRLYRLTFVPADPAQAGVYTQMEALFAKVLSTFRFLP
jgi:uncharacterized protein YxjI